MRHISGWIVLGILVTVAVWALPPFRKIYGAKGLNRGNAVREMSDSGFIVAGYTSGSGAGGEDAWLLRTDAAGDVQWEKTYGGGGNDQATAVLELPEGGFALTGTTTSFGNGGSDILVLRVDENGTVVWMKTFGGAQDDSGLDLDVTMDGGLIVVGETASSGQGGKDVWLGRLDGEGNLLWFHTFGGAGDDRALSVQQLVDGGFILAGTTARPEARDRDGYVLRTDFTGEVLWTKNIGGEHDELLHCVRLTNDEGFILTGHRSVSGKSGHEVLLVKLSEAGELRWQSTFGDPDDYRIMYGEQAIDFGYVLGGIVISAKDGQSRACLIKTDRDGQFRWEERVEPSEWPEATGARCYRAIQLNDGNFALVGDILKPDSSTRALLARLKERY